MVALLYLLDTSVLLNLVRGRAIGASIEATLRLTRQQDTPLVCIVTHGEIWSLARENHWGAAKRAALQVLLANFVTVDIHSDDVIEAYVEIEDASRRAPGGSVKMGKNDLWIAAVTKVTGAALLTCDKDFDHLDPGLISRIYIDPRGGSTPSPGAQP